MTLVEDEYRAERDAKGRETYMSEMPDKVLVYPETGDAPIRIWAHKNTHNGDGREPVLYTRTSLIATKNAEISQCNETIGLMSLELAKLREENDRLVRWLASERFMRLDDVEKEIKRIREELRGGGV